MNANVSAVPPRAFKVQSHLQKITKFINTKILHMEHVSAYLSELVLVSAWGS